MTRKLRLRLLEKIIASCVSFSNEGNYIIYQTRVEGAETSSKVEITTRMDISSSAPKKNLPPLNVKDILSENEVVIVEDNLILTTREGIAECSRLIWRSECLLPKGGQNNILYYD